MSPSWARGDKVPTVKYQEYEDRIKALEEELRLAREEIKQERGEVTRLYGLMDTARQEIERLESQVRTLARRLNYMARVAHDYELDHDGPFDTCNANPCKGDRAALDAVNMEKKETRDGGE